MCVLHYRFTIRSSSGNHVKIELLEKDTYGIIVSNIIKNQQTIIFEQIFSTINDHLSELMTRVRDNRHGKIAATSHLLWCGNGHCPMTIRLNINHILPMRHKHLTMIIKSDTGEGEEKRILMPSCRADIWESALAESNPIDTNGVKSATIGEHQVGSQRLTARQHRVAHRKRLLPFHDKTDGVDREVGSHLRI